MKEYNINGVNYQFVKGDQDIIDLDFLKEKVTEYFDEFDYIFGDMAYNKIRLKGFFDSNNKKVKKINDIKGLDNYINTYCAYGCKWFLLKKIQ